MTLRTSVVRGLPPRRGFGRRSLIVSHWCSVRLEGYSLRWSIDPPLLDVRSKMRGHLITPRSLILLAYFPDTLHAVSEQDPTRCDPLATPKTYRRKRRENADHHSLKSWHGVRFSLATNGLCVNPSEEFEPGCRAKAFSPATVAV